VNKIWVIGAKEASTESKEQQFSYDGNNRIFNLGYEPNYVEAYEWNGSLWDTKVIGEEKNYNETQDFLYNKVEKNVTIPSHVTVPVSGKFKIEYRPTIEIIDFFEDLDSQNKYGIYEKALKSKDIKTKAEARKLTRTELKNKSNTIAVINFSTFDFRPLKVGSLVNVVLSRYAIDTVFLITDLTIDYDLSNASALANVTAQGVVR
jgi:hypothetical protein